MPYFDGLEEKKEILKNLEITEENLKEINDNTYGIDHKKEE